MRIPELFSRRYINDKSVLIVSIFIAALCSLVYELLISTVASYFLGDSIKQFSITIGLYMASMGIGSYISRLIQENLLAKFIAVEILLGLIGGLAVPMLYLCYALTDAFYFAFILLIVVIGSLTGLEVPLLTRIMERQYTLRTNISNVLSLDYLGALLATLAFPFVLLPFLGTFKSSLLFGMINMGVGLLNLWYFADRLALDRRRVLYTSSAIVCTFLGALLVFSQGILDEWNDTVYDDRVVYTKQTPYQKLVMTRYKDDVRLYINGNLQFSSMDEHRYHEPLVHVPMAAANDAGSILVLGGGDGLAVRELLKYPSVTDIQVVDLDPEMFRLARNHPYFVRLNANSLNDPRVETISKDAFVFLQEARRQYDVIIADLPDPNNISLARLYSREFYGMVRRALAPGGVFVTQSTSPYYAQQAFWSINASLESAGFRYRYPYHVNVPSFGEWGFVMAADQRIETDDIAVSVETRFLTGNSIPTLFVFPKDLAQKRHASVSTLDRPRVLDYYLEGWQYWK